MKALQGKILLSVDGQDIRVDSTVTIKEAAAFAGITIPGLCHFPGGESGSDPCGICVVEADGVLVESCRTKVSPGMRVKTTSAAIDKHRKQLLEKLVSFHYGDCKVPCNLTCPAGINVQGYVNYIARGEFGAAFDLIRENQERSLRTTWPEDLGHRWQPGGG